MNSLSSPTHPTSILWKLFAMMVLQFFIWGAWLPLIYTYLPGLGFTPSQQLWILSAFPIAALFGLFFSNQLADRHFASEKVFTFSHLVGGLALLGCGFVTSFWPFFGLMLIHCLFYVPTLSIANSIAFANLTDPKREFGLVRTGGTIGWILAAWLFTFIFVDWVRVKEAIPSGFADWIGTVLANGLTGRRLVEATRWAYVVAGITSLVLAGFSLTLPHTPPHKSTSNEDKLAWWKAVRFLRKPYLLILWIVAFVDAFASNCFFHWTGGFLGATRAAGGMSIPGNWVMPVMTVGQIAELLTLFTLGATLKNLGWRWTMILGVLGHTARFLVYAFFPDNPLLIAVTQILHGVCRAFFFATLYIFIDAYFPKDIRSSVQGLFNVMILGIGALIANWLCPFLLQEVFTRADETIDYRNLFLVPAACAAAAAVALAIFFHPPKVEPGDDRANTSAS